MKTIFLGTLVLLSVTALTGCWNRYEPFQAYFWTNSEPGKTYYLLVNDSNRGVLPYLPVGPTCNNNDSKKQALHLTMESGSYKLAVVNEEGVVKYALTYSVYQSINDKQISSSSNYRNGKVSSSTSGDCLITNLQF